MICAKFGKDLFNTSKVIGCKKSAQFFFTHSVDGYAYTVCCQAKKNSDMKRPRDDHSELVSLVTRAH